MTETARGRRTARLVRARKEVVMRFIGCVLVLLGALALGKQEITYVTSEPVDESDGPAVRQRECTLWVPPVVSGIAVVSGLLLVVTDTCPGGHLNRPARSEA
jgi:hypothetical protein